MKNIAIVHSVSEIGGAERMSEVLLKTLSNDTQLMYLVTPEQGPFTARFANSKVRCTQLDITSFSLKTAPAYLVQVCQWVRFLKREKIAVVHTADPFCSQAILPACKLARVKVVAHFHFPFTKGVLQWAYAKLAPDVAVFCSEELQRSTGTTLSQIAPNTQQHVIHNGVDETIFKPSPITALSVPIKIGIIANLQERKGHHEFIQMAKQLSEQHVNAEYLVIGGDILAEPRLPMLQQQVEELGLSKYFNFVGQIDNVVEWLAKLDIYVCASHQEAFPVSILEAMASQKIIVTTDVNGIVEALNEQTAYLVPAKSASSLSDAVLQIMSQPQVAIQKAKLAQERLVTHFSLQRYVDKWKSLYQSLYS